MMTNITFHLKKELWISILTTSLVFIILILVPLQVLAVLGDGDSYASGCRGQYWGYQWFDDTSGTLYDHSDTGFTASEWSWAIWKYNGGWELWTGRGGIGCQSAVYIDVSMFPDGDYNWASVQGHYLPFNVLSGVITWKIIPSVITASFLIINSPISASTASTTFPLNFTYNLEGENYNKLLVVFEAWTIIGSTTCPIYGTPEWTEEYNNGWFYNQSLPYFSPVLTSTSTTATSSISIYNLDEPYFYNCVHCYFYNKDTLEKTTAEKCPNYTLNILGFVSPSQPLPIGSWQNYYASHTDSKYPTSTAIFDTITGSLSDLVQKVISFVNDFKIFFDSQNAYDKGLEMGAGIPLMRGYLKPINDFFGNLPISEIFIFCIIVLLVVVVYRIVARILHLIRG